ncbi:hypothetical protein ADIS_2758 [Lunatimonas lonarensis]|uniref:Uncharacterized protein n=1 Tax=Lunatimonas lonarensis TaxID=1232681 RepID=R7ZRZ2_9BACT|nr:hypothetical protein ADIS_2758 [Lunatimonas lonarensis]
MNSKSDSPRDMQLTFLKSISFNAFSIILTNVHKNPQI